VQKPPIHSRRNYTSEAFAATVLNRPDNGSRKRLPCSTSLFESFKWYLRLLGSPADAWD
jgi:hypothetical protein